MSFLPPALGGTELMAWRLDQANFARTWDSGEGAFRVGGRWNSVGVRTVYMSLDPATAILEVAVHKGFRALDVVPHVLTAAEVLDKTAVYVVQHGDLLDDEWLTPGIPRAAQQRFGDALLAEHAMIAIPSAVSPNSWNLIFDPARARPSYALRFQEPFVLDPRLHGA